MEVVEILKAVDGYVALAVAVWVIQVGLARLEKTDERYNGFVTTVLNQQQANNQSLADLVKDLCQR
jgi:hypothetical protein